MEEVNGYQLSRTWFDFCFENPDLVSPNHSAIYFFAIEHCNRLGWKKKFGFPTTMAMEAVGIKSYNTYVKTLRDLVDWGFIIMIEKSKNQYSSNIIALSNFNKALDKALDKALIKHTTKQSESTVQSNSSINKQITINQLTNKQENPTLSEIEALEVAEYLLDSIIHYDSTHKYSRNPPSLTSWVTDIDRAIRLDGRTVEQLKYIIEYVFRANKKNSDFWASNMESGAKLRKHFDKIKLQIKQEKQNGKATLTDINRNAALGVANLQFDDAG